MTHFRGAERAAKRVSGFKRSIVVLPPRLWQQTLHFCTATPLRISIARYLLAAIVVIGVSLLLPQTSLGQGGGIIAFVVVVLCSYYLGIGPAILSPLLLALTFRFRAHGLMELLAFSSKELFDICMITLVTTTVGIAGALRRRSQLTVNRQQLALLEQDRRKDQFLATLAHELRNPLAPIRTGLSILRMMRTNPPQDPQSIDDVHLMMQRQVDHLVRLIDDLLDVSRINTGKISLRRESFTLTAVVQDAVDATRPHIDSAQLSLHISLPVEPVMIFADRGRIAQVLMNLLQNSAKFTNPGGNIWLTGTKSGDVVQIRVRDSGVGISGDMLPRIFEMFNQGSQLLTRQHGGLGIGLSIARTLVEMHHGKLDAQSDGPGCGSEFTIQLPVNPTGRAVKPSRSQETMPPSQSDVSTVITPPKSADTRTTPIQEKHS